MLCDSLDLLPSLETLSVVYDPTWTLPWIKLSYCLARRPSIKTLIVHDTFAVPDDEKEYNYRQVLEVVGRQGLRILWVK